VKSEASFQVPRHALITEERNVIVELLLVEPDVVEVRQYLLLKVIWHGIVGELVLNSTQSLLVGRTHLLIRKDEHHNMRE
jgi:hypothetical protein